MEKIKIQLSEEERIAQAYAKMQKSNLNQKVGGVIFAIVMVAVIVLFCGWQFGWFESLNCQQNPQPFSVEISKAIMEPVNGDVVVNVMVTGDGKETNIIPAQIKITVTSYKAGEQMLEPKEEDVDIISGKLDGKIEKGRQFPLSVKKGEYEIVPFLYYYDSNEEKKMITGKTQVYHWDETGFHKEE